MCTDIEKQINISKRTKITGETRMIRIIKKTIGMTWVNGMTRITRMAITTMTRITKVTRMTRMTGLG